MVALFLLSLSIASSPPLQYIEEMIASKGKGMWDLSLPIAPHCIRGLK